MDPHEHNVHNGRLIADTRECACFIALISQTARGFISTQEIYFSISGAPQGQASVNCTRRSAPHILYWTVWHSSIHRHSFYDVSCVWKLVVEVTRVGYLRESCVVWTGCLVRRPTRPKTLGNPSLLFGRCLLTLLQSRLPVLWINSHSL